jgi:hypothetical protein
METSLGAWTSSASCAGGVHACRDAQRPRRRARDPGDRASGAYREAMRRRTARRRHQSPAPSWRARIEEGFLRPAVVDDVRRLSSPRSSAGVDTGRARLHALPLVRPCCSGCSVPTCASSPRARPGPAGLARCGAGRAAGTERRGRATTPSSARSTRRRSGRWDPLLQMPLGRRAPRVDAARRRGRRPQPARDRPAGARPPLRPRGPQPVRSPRVRPTPRSTLVACGETASSDRSVRIRPALDAGPRHGLGDRGVRMLPPRRRSRSATDRGGLDGPLRRDPAAHRPRAARGRRPRGARERTVHSTATS